MNAECATACAPYQLALPASPLSGRAGERLGRGTGSSIEFMDFRDYAPGDDVRHIDWRGYARTDQLRVRLFREEIAPELEIVADLSPSMTVTEAKERALRDLVEAAAEWARRATGRARRLASGGDRFEDADYVAFSESPEPLPLVPLRPRSLRLWISDFLFANDPAPLIRRFSAGAAHIYVLQLLDPWEMDPQPEGALSLVDAEAGVRLDIHLDERAVTSYKERLGRLRESVRRATHAAGGTYSCVVADTPAKMFRDALLMQGVIEPR